jgi:hypothetical protein
MGRSKGEVVANGDESSMQTGSGDRNPMTLDAVAAELRRASDGEDGHVNVLELLRIAVSVNETDARRIADFILEHLLPLCTIDAGDDVNTQLTSNHARELLAQWLGTLSDRTLWDVRRAVLDALCAGLRLAPTFGGIYSVAKIGFRDDDVIAALREVGERHDRLGHEALRMLIGLRPDKNVREWIAKQLADVSAGAEHSEESLSAVAQLHDPGWLDLLVAEATVRDSLFSLARLSWVADGEPGNEALQATVWAAIEKAANTRPKGWAELMFTSGVIARCITPHALASVVGVLPKLNELGEVHVRRWCERVQEVECFTQLRGWTLVDTREVADILRPLIARDSGNDGVGLTAEGHSKEQAIEAWLCSGDRAALDIASTAIELEASAYLKAHALRSCAVLSMTELPREVSTILLTTGELERRSDAFSKRLALFSAASQLAASSLSFDSLRLSLDSTGTINGDSLRAPVEAAAIQAVWLNERDERVLPLLTSSLSQQSLVARTIGVRSLLYLSAAGKQLPDEVTKALKDIVSGPERKPYVRTDALYALGWQWTHDLAEADRDWLVELCIDKEQTVQHAAFTALIEAGAWTDVRSKVESSILSQTAEWNADVIGRLAAVEGHSYEAIASQLVRSADADTCYGVLVGYDTARRVSASHSSASPLADALVARIRREEGPHTSNAMLLDYLEKLAPQRVLSEPWDEIWQDWMPASRETLAWRLGDVVPQDEQGVEVRRAWLRFLVCDGSFRVRRAAGRVFAKVDEDVLRDWCNEAGRSGLSALRAFAAEASSWLPIDNASTLDNSLLRRAAKDPERRVRDAAERSRLALKRRTWAAELWVEMMKPRTDPNDWVLSSYAAGVALAKIGDDFDLVHVERASEDPRLPPNVRYWLSQVKRNLEAQWKKTTEGWPEPWKPWRGDLEHLEGTITVGDQSRVVWMDLWHRRRRTQGEPSEWGGVVSIPDDENAHSIFDSEIDEATIDIAGRATAKAVVVSFAANRIVLAGSGSYPHRLTPAT